MNIKKRNKHEQVLKVLELKFNFIKDERIKQTTHLILIYPAHFEDVPGQSGVNPIFEC